MPAPVPGQAVLGLNAVTYYNTSEDYASPTWSPANNVQDVTINQSLAAADVSTRGSTYRKQVGTLAEGSIDFTMMYSPGDDLFDILNQAFAKRSLTDMAFADGDGEEGTTNAPVHYFRAEFSILDFTQEQPLEDAMKVNVTLASGFSKNEPYWGIWDGSAEHPFVPTPAPPLSF